MKIGSELCGHDGIAQFRNGQLLVLHAGQVGQPFRSTRSVSVPFTHSLQFNCVHGAHKGQSVQPLTFFCGNGVESFPHVRQNKCGHA